VKLTTIALASAFSSTIALADTTRKLEGRIVHHRTTRVVQSQPSYGNTVLLRPNYGNPNGDPDGPTTLSGTGSSQFGGSSPGTSGYN
jgi:hypothetical protein